MKRTSLIAWDLVVFGTLVFLAVAPTCLSEIRTRAGYLSLLAPELFIPLALAALLVVAGFFGRSSRAWLRGKHE
jgi:hypothetical protein